MAFLSKESGRTTFGSDDFTKKISDNAITYSNGQNSGIVIENVSSAGEEITFDIKFTDTSNLNIWDVVGNTEVSNKTNNDIAMDAVGDKVYVVYNEDNKLKAKIFDGSSWTSLGDSIINSKGNNPTIKVYNNIVYVLYHDSSYRSVVSRFVNNKWETVQTLTSDTSQYSDMIATNDGIYIAITSFHQELLPTELLFSILSARENVPFPIILELLLMEISFELIREASLRVPSLIGSSIGIVGALILGDAEKDKLDRTA